MRININLRKYDILFHQTPVMQYFALYYTYFIYYIKNIIVMIILHVTYIPLTICVRLMQSRHALTAWFPRERRNNLYDVHKSSTVSMDEFMINIGTMITLGTHTTEYLNAINWRIAV